MSAAVARRYFLRGREALRSGDNDIAAQNFAAALELYPDFVEARVGHSVVLALTDPPRAANVLRYGLNRAPRPSARAQLSCALGDVLVAAGDFLGAEVAYADAIAIGGSLPNLIHSRLARLHAKMGHHKQAFESLLAASRIA